MVNLQRILMCSIAAVAAAIFAGAAHAVSSGCSTSWGCGANAATVGDGIVFDELNSKHKLKDDVQLIDAYFMVDGTKKMVELNVVGHVLSAKDRSGTPYTGIALQNMIMTIGHTDGRQYEVKVDKVCVPVPIEGSLPLPPSVPGRVPRKGFEPECPPLDFWVNPMPDNRVPYFELTVRKTRLRKGSRANECLKQPDENRCTEREFTEQVCKGEALTDDKRWLGYKNAAIFYEGDRFDAKRKRVSAAQQRDGWFNLACAGAVTAKMHLLRHTAAGADAAHLTTLEQRTAMLKMLTADFCGDGKTWTADGTPLFYTDARSWHPTPSLPVPGPIEALWGPNGALCLENPRRAPNPIPGCKPPAVTRQAVVDACNRNIPMCDERWAEAWKKSLKHTADSPYVLSAIEPNNLGFCNLP